MNSGTAPGRAPLLSIALLSATVLAYEILLMRLFSIGQWHHFAYMIISMALLGYGASGTFLTLAQHRLLKRFPIAYLGNVALFAVSMTACYLLAQRVPFNAEEVLWDAAQPLYLMAIYLLLTVPFFFAANAVALALSHYRQMVSRVYAVDLLGAGLGSLAVIAILYSVFPMKVLAVLGALAGIAAAVGARELGLSPRTALLLLAVLLPAVLPALNAGQVISPYKGLQQTLRMPGMELVAERSSPLGLISIVEPRTLPLRHAPGLSIVSTTGPPDQVALFTDADGMTAITRYTGDADALDHLDQMTSALPYHLGKPRNVLVLGAGGGADVLQARLHDVQSIDAVELNPDIVRLVRDDYADFAGGLYDAPDVRVHIAEARGFVAGSNRRYDLIQLALLDSFGASSAGLYALSENYLYTVESLQTFLAHLAPDGYLAISRWAKLPPRDTLKLFATAARALSAQGLADPGRRMILIRSWQTSTLLIKNGEVQAEEVTALREFCDERLFDVAYYPDMPSSEANRYNVLHKPYFHEGASALLGDDASQFLERYKFNLEPATDDRPYFFNFFKWQVLPEILALRGRGGMPLLESGYLVLVATLVQAMLASVILILLPLRWHRRRSADGDGTGKPRVFTYFFAVGLAFLFIEMAFLQKFILFLHHPLYAAAVVLCAFLVFAGLGSYWSNRQARRDRHWRGAAWAIAGIAVLGIAYIVLLGPLFALLMPLPGIIKVPVAIALIAPLAFCMGMPFPLALGRLGREAPDLIPWAWGVNGCASVLSAVLATLLAIHFGFTTVVAAALALYVLAALSFPQAKAV